MESTEFTPWPEALADQYRQQGFWSGITLFDLLSQQAQIRPHELAIACEVEALSYRELFTAAAELATFLQQHRLGYCDRILVQLTNSSFFVKLLLASLQLGIKPVLALPAHRKQEIRYLAEFSDSKAIVVPAATDRFDYQSMATEIADEIDCVKHVFSQKYGAMSTIGSDDRSAKTAIRADDRRRRVATADEVALYLLSGGTTGMPKLIPRTHNDYALNMRVASAVSGIDRQTRYLVALPAAHNFPLACPGILGTLAAGGQVIMAPSPTAEVAFPLIEAHHVTHTAVVPAVAMRWLDSNPQAYDLSSLDVLQVGGSRLPAHAARRIKPTLGCQLQQVFGMAEGLLNYTRLDASEEIVNETQGMPASVADEIRVVDADGHPVADGDVGELLTRGPYTIRGYFKAPDHNARSFTDDGFYRSGDLVRRRPDGNLVVEGRIKDVINRGGEKISAEEIENHCLSHPTVKNVAVVALPDEELGERICAVVVAESIDSSAGSRLRLEDLRAHLAGNGIAAFKLPEKLLLRPELPLTSVGKIDKKRLRELVAGQDAGSNTRR